MLKTRPKSDVHHVQLPHGILPRLTSVRGGLDGVIRALSQETAKLAGLPRRAGSRRYLPGEARRVRREELVCLAVCVLMQARDATARIHSIGRIPEVMPAAVSEVRTVGALLYGAYPEHSATLYGLASLMGAILVDSACISGARIDFGRSCAESSLLLDKAKLIACSKSGNPRPNQPIPVVSGV